MINNRLSQASLRHTVAAIALVASAFIQTPVSAGVTTQTVTYKSQALDKETTYIAALPSPLVPDRQYPVLYLLHGATGTYSDWSDKTTVTAQIDGRDMILIMPDGSPYGWYIDSPLKPESQYETAISKDLIQDVEKRFPARRDRNGRAIAGLSMGGHGALSLAAKHPDIYSAASSLSGILDIAAHPNNWRMAEILGKQPDALDQWKNNSVYHLADRFTTANVALLFDTGLQDATGAVDDSQRLHKKLEELGVTHIYREFPGKHNWAYWQTHIGEHLDFHQENFRKAEKD